MEAQLHFKLPPPPPAAADLGTWTSVASGRAVNVDCVLGVRWWDGGHPGEEQDLGHVVMHTRQKLRVCRADGQNASSLAAAAPTAGSGGTEAPACDGRSLSPRPSSLTHSHCLRSLRVFGSDTIIFFFSCSAS